MPARDSVDRKIHQGKSQPRGVYVENRGMVHGVVIHPGGGVQLEPDGNAVYQGQLQRIGDANVVLRYLLEDLPLNLPGQTPGESFMDFRLFWRALFICREKPGYLFCKKKLAIFSIRNYNL